MMPRKTKDLSGKIYGTLLVLRQGEYFIYPSGHKEITWVCRCLNCGKEYVVKASVLKRMKSCGCLRRSLITQEDKYIQGIWKAMLSRCRNPNNLSYDDYGGRGITVCDEWLHFRSFQKWCHENNYKIGLSIDRINPNGNYEPQNCRLATQKEQQRNRRNNKILIDPFSGESMCASALAEKYKINYQYFLKCLKNKNESLKDIISNKRRDIT